MRSLFILLGVERGVVWEETIILLPDKVNYVFLSATILNASQFAQWICQLHHQVLWVDVHVCFCECVMTKYMYIGGLVGA